MLGIPISPWKVVVVGLALAAAMLIGGSLWWQEKWERETFANWPPAKAEVISAAMEPQAGWTGTLGLKPVYQGSVELRLAGAPAGTSAHAEFVFHSLWQRDVERLQRRLHPGAVVTVRRSPQDVTRVHIPQTFESATPLLAYAAGFVVAIAAAVVELLRRLRGLAQTLQGLWYDKPGGKES